MQEWIPRAFFYHLYSLGFSDAPRDNDFVSPAVFRYGKILSWADHLQNMGVNALLLGPVLESSSHGYDIVDYYHMDRRLGDNPHCAEVNRQLKERGFRLVLDSVFHHVGRDFWAFRDVIQRGADSKYADWFSGLDFGGASPYGDSFSYEGWNGHLSLVKLNLKNPEVVQHLLGAVDLWCDSFQIDGLRLDAADWLDLDFIKTLNTHLQSRGRKLWLMGEVVHGDYRKWMGPGLLDSVTNYECYKGIYSSHNDKNFFEIAYSLSRQFGDNGIYQDQPMYNFVDNHDVDRLASKLTSHRDLVTAYCLLFTMPGVPSLYYGSEWALKGQKIDGQDSDLRPGLDLEQLQREHDRDLVAVIGRLAKLRQLLPALQVGGYQECLVESKILAFARPFGEGTVYVVLNASDEEQEVTLSCGGSGELVDELNQGSFPIRDGRAIVTPVWPHWMSVLSRRK